MSKKYEVTVDGETEEVTTKKEVDATLKEVLADGEPHEVAVAEVVPEKEEEKVEADAKSDESEAAPSNAFGGLKVIL